MKAMLIKDQEQLVWSEVPEPVINEEEVLVLVHAAAVNRADILQRQGKYPSPAGSAPWMGLEIAGVILKLGRKAAKNSTWKIGDKVCALLGGGGYAEKAAVHYKLLLPIPGNLSFEEAASLPEAYSTCYLNLFVEGGFKEGDTVFFPAGASGLASVGIPMAKAFGGYVITSVRDEMKKKSIIHLGADVIVDTSREDIVKSVQEEMNKGHEINVAIDCLAGETIGELFPYVHEGCRWIIISTLAGETTQLPLRILLTKGIVLKGSMLRKRSIDEKGKILKALVEKVWIKLAKGIIKPTIYKILPMTEAREAQAILERGESVGKVVLKVR